MYSRSENDGHPILLIRTGAVIVQMYPGHVVSRSGHVFSGVGDVHVRPDGAGYSGVTGVTRVWARREFLGHLLLNTLTASLILF